jgi:hypothetical protein
MGQLTNKGGGINYDDAPPFCINAVDIKSTQCSLSAGGSRGGNLNEWARNKVEYCNGC